MRKRFGKLIRDKVLNLIRRTGAVANFRIMDSHEYKRELMYKLIDEAEEVRKASYDETNKSAIQAELADLFEVVEAIIKEFKLDKKEIQKMQQFKKAQKGGFARRIFLESVEFNEFNRDFLDEIE